MGTCYVLPNSWLKGIKLETLSGAGWIFESVALWKWAFFTEHHGEIMSLADFNITINKNVVAPDSLKQEEISCCWYSSLSSLFEYKTHQLSATCKTLSFVVGECRHARVWYGCALLFCPALIVGPLWLSSHYQCPTHVRLPLTVLVAHWPQRGTKRTNPPPSQNAEQLLGICRAHMRLLRICLIPH